MNFVSADIYETNSGQWVFAITFELEDHNSYFYIVGNLGTVDEANNWKLIAASFILPNRPNGAVGEAWNYMRPHVTGKFLTQSSPLG